MKPGGGGYMRVSTQCLHDQRKCCDSHQTCCLWAATTPELLLGTEAPVMTPNGIDFSFLCFQPTDTQVLVTQASDQPEARYPTLHRQHVSSQAGMQQRRIEQEQ